MALNIEESLADAQARNEVASAIGLDWVGMEGIALPIEIAGKPVNATVNAGIDLLATPKGQKGIHMSRLYQALDALTQGELTPTVLKQTLTQFLQSHRGQASCATVQLSGDILLSRPSLLSGQRGWKAYPFEIHAELHHALRLKLKIGVPYSSTCPSSAALSVQVAQQQFRLDFAHQSDSLSVQQVVDWLDQRGLPATPHSQRSWAWVSVTLAAESSQFPVIELIDRIEGALGTAVQTLVKRADEQAFAVANGQNLMFCEDAARRLYRTLTNQDDFAQVDIRVEHHESLHAHNAVAVTGWKRGVYAA